MSIYKPPLFILLELGRTSFRRIVRLFFWVFSLGLQSHRSLTVVSFLPSLTSAPVTASTAFLKVSKSWIAQGLPSADFYTSVWCSGVAACVATNKHESGTQISCLGQGQRHAWMPRLAATSSRPQSCLLSTPKGRLLCEMQLRL